jgi:hypothetical protein
MLRGGRGLNGPAVALLLLQREPHRPAKPAQKAFIERSNQTFPTGLLDANVFASLVEVRALMAECVWRWNTERLPLGPRVPATECLSRPVRREGKVSPR